jgi:hypothetical protein
LAERVYRIRGRNIGDEELRLIRKIISLHGTEGRSAISRILCEQWNWRQANGLLMDRGCRVMLLALEKKGEINLPPRLRKVSPHAKRADRKEFCYDDSELHGKVSEFGSLTIRMVRQSPDEGLWDFLVDKYHYLGRPWIVGAYLKYLAYLDERLVACLGWGSGAWKVACRDSFIGWDKDTRESNLHKVVNNVRFLILPWVRIRHLASKVLSLNIRSLPHDWQGFYHQPVTLLETFVDTSRFQGTCYKASNWMYAGLTKGRGKYDRYNRCDQPIKAVYLYPLRKNFREALHAAG